MNGPFVSAPSEPTRPAPDATRKDAIRFDGIAKSFSGRVAVRGIDLRIPAGCFTVLVGPSGCGKSTLLNMVAGLSEPSEGYVFVRDRLVDGPTEDTALLFQSYNLFPWLTAVDNVAFGLETLGMKRGEARDEARRLLANVGLADYADRVPSALSGGMRQRVALVRAFARRPKILLMDEPFAALDYQTRKMMQAYLLATWQNTGATVVMVTHDLDEALFLADQLVLISGSPGSVAEVIDIDLPRPRDKAHPELNALYQRLEAHMEAEAARGEFSPEELAAIEKFRG
jgi:NitT/TauT family transport system ATP-binding protein